MDLPLSHPYIADSLVVSGFDTNTGYLVKAAASHDSTLTRNIFQRRKSVFDEGRIVEDLYRKQKWSVADTDGSKLDF